MLSKLLYSAMMTSMIATVIFDGGLALFLMRRHPRVSLALMAKFWVDSYIFMNERKD